MDETTMTLLFDGIADEEILQNFSDAGVLLTASQENALDSIYTDSFQELQTNGIIHSTSSATGALPSVDRHLGEHNFEVYISPEANGPDCLYSETLNKIFVNMDKPIPVLFRTTSHTPELYVRALAIYVSCTDLHLPVRRCVTHKENDTEGNKDVNLVEHVVRCISPNAMYYKATDSGRFSVRVPLDAPQAGTPVIKICFKLTCLSSCRTRTKMGIIFTLENKKEDVLGRQFMNIRVCSCPRRDKEKEEMPKDETKNKKKALKRSSDTFNESGNPKKCLKSESAENPLVPIPVQLCQIREVAKFAMDLIYRDLGMEQRAPTEREEEVLAYYRQVIETPDEALHQWISSA